MLKMKLNYWYWFVFISKTKSKGSDIKNHEELIVEISADGRPECSGILLRDDIVLTTASCLRKVFDLYTVRIPYIDPLRPKNYHVDYVIREILIHPSFKSHKMADYNVALLQLASRTKRQTLAKIDIIGLSHSLSNRSLYIIGWGRSYNGTLRTSGHMIQKFNSSTSFLCTISYPIPLNFDTEFCLDYQNRSSGLSNTFYENGSGLFTIYKNNMVLVGILAWPGLQFQYPRVPVFARISGVKDWLAKSLRYV